MPHRMRKFACDRCFQRKKSCDGMPCKRCQTGNHACVTTCQERKNGRPRSSVKSSHARAYSRSCIPCRQQKKKCDKGVPICARCLSQKWSCSYDIGKSDSKIEYSESPSTVFETDAEPVCFSGEENTGSSLNAFSETKHSPESFEETVNDTPTNQLATVDLVRLCQVNIPNISAHELEYIHYFSRNVSPLLFAETTTPRFSDVAIPLCFSDSRVRYPILAMASSHWSNRPNVVRIDVFRDAVRFRAKAQSSMTEKNDGIHNESENALLGLALVALQEMLEGISLSWNCALKRGAQIIHKRGGLNRAMRSSPFAVQLLFYLDQVASLSTRATPHISRVENIPNYETSEEQAQDFNFDASLGVLGDLYSVMGNVATLASLSEDRYKSAADSHQFDVFAELIRSKLRRWTPYLLNMGNTAAIDYRREPGNPAGSSCFLALQLALLLRLHQIVNGYDRLDPRVLELLSLLMSALKSMKQNNRVGFIFPLVMAGSVCVEEEDRRYIASRLQSLQERLCFRYIGEFGKLLSEIWQSDATLGNSVNWANIYYYKFPGSVML